MFITPIKTFPHDRLGHLHRGHVVEVEEEEGKRLLRLRLVNPAAAPVVKTEAIVTKPLPGKAVGATIASSASQAAPASPQTTLSESERGVTRRRGRPRKQAAE